MKEKKQNFISPSQIERVCLCPGSVPAQEKVNLILPPNPAAVEGTAIHELGKHCLVKNVDPAEMHGFTMEITYGMETFPFVVDDDFVFAVRVYRNTILDILAKDGLDYRVLQTEVYSDCPEVPLPNGNNFGGTSDCKFIAGSTLHIFDLKGGRGIIVDPTENKQCMSYALRFVIDTSKLIDKVVLWIVQPRAKEGEFVKSWETTPERIIDFLVELRRAIAETQVENPTLCAGSHCKYCLAAGNCSAIQEGIIEKTSLAIPKIHTVFPKVSSLTPEQIGKALPALEALKNYIQILGDYALTLLHRGQEVPNYVLVKGRKNRQWKDELSVRELLSKHLSEDEYLTTPNLLSPAKVEKLVDKALLKDYIFTPEGDLKIVMEKEAKDYIKRNVADVFSDVKFD